MKRYKAIIDEDDNESGVQLISVVSRPAMSVKEGVQSVLLSEDEKKPKKVHLSSEPMKQYFTSIVALPDKNIYRRDKDEEYEIVFSSEVIEKMRNKFHEKTGNLKLSNLNHSAVEVNSTIIESWVKTSDEDKSNAFGFKAPIGTWFTTMKIHDTDFWNNEIVSGNITGMSLEGIFRLEEIDESTKLSEQENLHEVEKDELSEFLDELVKYLNK